MSTGSISGSFVIKHPLFRRELKETFGLAIPIIITQLGMISMGLVDTIMVGHLGALELGAVSLGNSLYMVIGLFAIGILAANDTFISQAFGQGKLKQCGRIFWDGIWVAVLITIPLTLFFMDTEWLFLLLGQEKLLAQTTDEYLFGRSFATIPYVVFYAHRNLLNGISRVKPIMYITIVANLVNILADWVLIYGHFGFSPMGVLGAGYATTVSRLFMYLAVFGLMFGKSFAPFQLGFRWPSSNGVKKIFKLGIPIGAQISMEVGVFSTVAVFMGWLGTDSLGAHQVALSLASFTFMVPLGLGITGTIRVGQAVGKKDFSKAYRAATISFILGTLFMSISAVIFAVFPRQLAFLFTTDVGVIAMAIWLLRIAAIFQILDALQVIGTGCLRGVGDTKSPFWANFVAHWLFGLPVGYYLAFGLEWGAPGLWVGLTLGLLGVAVVLPLKFYKGNWKTNLTPSPDQGTHS